MGFEWYTEFVDLGHEPGPDELIALFRIEPAEGVTMEEAAGRVASESSIGTWTTLSTMTPELRSLMAKVFRIKGRFAWISYPKELFEEGSIPQILSSIAGNVFGMKALRRLRLVDFSMPSSMVSAFPGPAFGIEGVRAILGVEDRPIVATVPKPKVGMDTETFARNAYEALIGGVDLIKDDENLTSQGFNPFERRLMKVMEAVKRAEEETGERKGYLVNVTAPCSDMLRRARLSGEFDNSFVMLDILTAGFAALQELRVHTEPMGLAIHAHRAFHAAFDRLEDHGMSMMVVAKLARLAGVDHIHIGTVVGKLVSPKEEVVALRDALTSRRFSHGFYLPQDWGSLKPVFPVSSGGLHPGILPDVFDILGTNIIVQVGGGIWGHPGGGRAGAAAVREAIDAYLRGESLEDRARESRELREALEKWGRARPE